MDTPEKKKPGRPLKHGVKLSSFLLRMTPDMRDELKAIADKNNVSMNDVVLKMITDTLVNTIQE